MHLLCHIERYVKLFCFLIAAGWFLPIIVSNDFAVISSIWACSLQYLFIIFFTYGRYDFCYLYDYRFHDLL